MKAIVQSKVIIQVPGMSATDKIIPELILVVEERLNSTPVILNDKTMVGVRFHFGDFDITTL